jgi:hypothetical protein
MKHGIRVNAVVSSVATTRGVDPSVVVSLQTWCKYNHFSRENRQYSLFLYATKRNSRKHFIASGCSSLFDDNHLTQS